MFKICFHLSIIQNDDIMFNELKFTPGVGLSLLIGAVGSVYLIIQSHRYFSKLSQRRCSSIRKPDVVCYMCNTNIKIEDGNSFATCRGCEKLVCRSEEKRCCEWISAIGIWECKNCRSNRVIQQKAGEWLLNQLTVRLQNPGPVNLKDEDMLGLCVTDSDDANSSTSSVSNNQKVKVREFIEELLSTMLNGPLDDVSVGKLMENESYIKVFHRYHSHLSRCLYNLELSIHQSLSDLPICEGQKFPESPSDKHFELRKLIQRILDEVAKLPELLNQSGHPLRPEEHLPYFSPKKYEQLLATAVLNKVVEDYRNPKNFEHVNSSAEPTPTKQQLEVKETATEPIISEPVTTATFDINHNKVSGNSELIQDNLRQMSMNAEEVQLKEELSSRSLSESDESYLSDYIQKHTVPLPDLSDTTGSSPEDDIVSLKSNATDGTWEENWLFKRRQLKSKESSIAMLVPSPTEEVKALIGDQNADEVSDLSETGSDFEGYESDSVGKDAPLPFSTSSIPNTAKTLEDIVLDSLISINSVASDEQALSEAKNSLLLTEMSNNALKQSFPTDGLVSIETGTGKAEASNSTLLKTSQNQLANNSESELISHQSYGAAAVETDDVKLMQERIQNDQTQKDIEGNILHPIGIARTIGNVDNQTSECDRKEIPIDREKVTEPDGSMASRWVLSPADSFNTADESEYKTVSMGNSEASANVELDSDASLVLEDQYSLDSLETSLPYEKCRNNEDANASDQNILFDVSGIEQLEAIKFPPNLFEITESPAVVFYVCEPNMHDFAAQSDDETDEEDQGARIEEITEQDIDRSDQNPCERISISFEESSEQPSDEENAETSAIVVNTCDPEILELTEVVTTKSEQVIDLNIINNNRSSDKQVDISSDVSNEEDPTLLHSSNSSDQMNQASLVEREQIDKLTIISDGTAHANELNAFSYTLQSQTEPNGTNLSDLNIECTTSSASEFSSNADKPDTVSNVIGVKENIYPQNIDDDTQYGKDEHHQCAENIVNLQLSDFQDLCAPKVVLNVTNELLRDSSQKVPDASTALESDLAITSENQNEILLMREPQKSDSQTVKSKQPLSQESSLESEKSLIIQTNSVKGTHEQNSESKIKHKLLSDSSHDSQDTTESADSESRHSAIMVSSLTVGNQTFTDPLPINSSTESFAHQVEYDDSISIRNETTNPNEKTDKCSDPLSGKADNNQQLEQQSIEEPESVSIENLNDQDATKIPSSTNTSSTNLSVNISQIQQIRTSDENDVGSNNITVMEQESNPISDIGSSCDNPQQMSEQTDFESDTIEKQQQLSSSLDDSVNTAVPLSDIDNSIIIENEPPNSTTRNGECDEHCLTVENKVDSTLENMSSLKMHKKSDHRVLTVVKDDGSGNLQETEATELDTIESSELLRIDSSNQTSNVTDFDGSKIINKSIECEKKNIENENFPTLKTTGRKSPPASIIELSALMEDSVQNTNETEELGCRESAIASTAAYALDTNEIQIPEDSLSDDSLDSNKSMSKIEIENLALDETKVDSNITENRIEQECTTISGDACQNVLINVDNINTETEELDTIGTDVSLIPSKVESISQSIKCDALNNIDNNSNVENEATIVTSTGDGSQASEDLVTNSLLHKKTDFSTVEETLDATESRPEIDATEDVNTQDAGTPNPSMPLEEAECFALTDNDVNTETIKCNNQIAECEYNNASGNTTTSPTVDETPLTCVEDINSLNAKSRETTKSMAFDQDTTEKQQSTECSNELESNKVDQSNNENRFSEGIENCSPTNSETVDGQLQEESQHPVNVSCLEMHDNIEVSTLEPESPVQVVSDMAVDTSEKQSSDQNANSFEIIDEKEIIVATPDNFQHKFPIVGEFEDATTEQGIALKDNTTMRNELDTIKKEKSMESLKDHNTNETVHVSDIENSSTSENASENLTLSENEKNTQNMECIELNMVKESDSGHIEAASAFTAIELSTIEETSDTSKLADAVMNITETNTSSDVENVIDDCEKHIKNSESSLMCNSTVEVESFIDVKDTDLRNEEEMINSVAAELQTSEKQQSEEFVNDRSIYQATESIDVDQSESEIQNNKNIDAVGIEQHTENDKNTMQLQEHIAGGSQQLEIPDTNQVPSAKPSVQIELETAEIQQADNCSRADPSEQNIKSQKQTSDTDTDEPESFEPKIHIVSQAVNESSVASDEIIDIVLENSKITENAYQILTPCKQDNNTQSVECVELDMAKEKISNIENETTIEETHLTNFEPLNRTSEDLEINASTLPMEESIDTIQKKVPDTISETHSLSTSLKDVEKPDDYVTSKECNETVPTSSQSVHENLLEDVQDGNLLENDSQGSIDLVDIENPVIENNQPKESEELLAIDHLQCKSDTTSFDNIASKSIEIDKQDIESKQHSNTQLNQYSTENLSIVSVQIQEHVMGESQKNILQDVKEEQLQLTSENLSCASTNQTRNATEIEMLSGIEKKQAMDDSTSTNNSEKDGVPSTERDSNINHLNENPQEREDFENDTHSVQENLDNDEKPLFMQKGSSDTTAFSDTVPIQSLEEIANDIKNKECNELVVEKEHDSTEENIITSTPNLTIDDKPSSAVKTIESPNADLQQVSTPVDTELDEIGNDTSIKPTEQIDGLNVDDKNDTDKKEFHAKSENTTSSTNQTIVDERERLNENTQETTKVVDEMATNELSQESLKVDTTVDVLEVTEATSDISDKNNVDPEITAGMEIEELVINCQISDQSSENKPTEANEVANIVGENSPNELNSIAQQQTLTLASLEQDVIDIEPNESSKLDSSRTSDEILDVECLTKELVTTENNVQPAPENTTFSTSNQIIEESSPADVGINYSLNEDSQDTMKTVDSKMVTNELSQESLKVGPTVDVLEVTEATSDISDKNNVDPEITAGTEIEELVINSQISDQSSQNNCTEVNEVKEEQSMHSLQQNSPVVTVTTNEGVPQDETTIHAPEKETENIVSFTDNPMIGENSPNELNSIDQQQTLTLASLEQDVIEIEPNESSKLDSLRTSAEIFDVECLTKELVTTENDVQTAPENTTSSTSNQIIEESSPADVGINDSLNEDSQDTMKTVDSKMVTNELSQESLKVGPTVDVLEVTEATSDISDKNNVDPEITAGTEIEELVINSQISDQSSQNNCTEVNEVKEEQSMHSLQQNSPVLTVTTSESVPQDETTIPAPEKETENIVSLTDNPMIGENSPNKLNSIDQQQTLILASLEQDVIEIEPIEPSKLDSSRTSDEIFDVECLTKELVTTENEVHNAPENTTSLTSNQIFEESSPADVGINNSLNEDFLKHNPPVDVLEVVQSESQILDKDSIASEIIKKQDVETEILSNLGTKPLLDHLPLDQQTSHNQARDSNQSVQETSIKSNETPVTLESLPQDKKEKAEKETEDITVNLMKNEKIADPEQDVIDLQQPNVSSKHESSNKIAEPLDVHRPTQDIDGGELESKENTIRSVDENLLTEIIDNDSMIEISQETKKVVDSEKGTIEKQQSQESLEVKPSADDFEITESMCEISSLDDVSSKSFDGEKPDTGTEGHPTTEIETCSTTNTLTNNAQVDQLTSPNLSIDSNQETQDAYIENNRAVVTHESIPLDETNVNTSDYGCDVTDRETESSKVNPIIDENSSNELNSIDLVGDNSLTDLEQNEIDLQQLDKSHSPTTDYVECHPNELDKVNHEYNNDLIKDNTVSSITSEPHMEIQTNEQTLQSLHDLSIVSNHNDTSDASKASDSNVNVVDTISFECDKLLSEKDGNSTVEDMMDITPIVPTTNIQINSADSGNNENQVTLGDLQMELPLEDPSVLHGESKNIFTGEKDSDVNSNECHEQLIDSKTSENMISSLNTSIEDEKPPADFKDIDSLSDINSTVSVEHLSIGSISNAKDDTQQFVEENHELAIESSEDTHVHEEKGKSEPVSVVRSVTEGSTIDKIIQLPVTISEQNQVEFQVLQNTVHNSAEVTNSTIVSESTFDETLKTTSTHTSTEHEDHLIDNTAESLPDYTGSDLTEPSSPEDTSTEAIAGSIDRASSLEDVDSSFTGEKTAETAIAAVTRQMRQYCEELKGILHAHQPLEQHGEELENVADLNDNTSICKTELGVEADEQCVVANPLDAFELKSAEYNQSLRHIDYVEEDVAITESAEHFLMENLNLVTTCEAVNVIPSAEEHAVNSSILIEHTPTPEPFPSYVYERQITANIEDVESLPQSSQLTLQDSITSIDDIDRLSNSPDMAEQTIDDITPPFNRSDSEMSSLCFSLPTVCVLNGTNSTNQTTADTNTLDLHDQPQSFVSETSFLTIALDSSEPPQLSAQSETNVHKPNEIEDVDEGASSEMLIPGSIAEREHLKWRNATPIANNPYSADILQKRLSESNHKSTFDDLSRLTSKDTLECHLEPEGNSEIVENDRSLQSVIDGNPIQYTRYGRDYYINDAKRASGTRKQASVGQAASHSTDDEKKQDHQVDEPFASLSSPLVSEELKSEENSLENFQNQHTIVSGRSAKGVADSPVSNQVSSGNYLSTVAREKFLSPADESTVPQTVDSCSEISINSRADESLTYSEDSDVTRIYEIGTGETKLVHGDILAQSCTSQNDEEAISSYSNNVVSEEIIEIIPQTDVFTPMQQERASSPTIDRSNLIKPRYVRMKQLSPQTIRFFSPKKGFSQNDSSLTSSALLSQSTDEIRDLSHLHSNQYHSSLHLDFPASRSVPSHEFTIEKEVMEVLPSVKELAKCYINSEVATVPKPILKPRIKLRKDFIRQSTDTINEKSQADDGSGMPQMKDKNQRMYKSTSSISAADEIREIRRLNLEVYNQQTFVPMAPGHSITARSLSKQIREDLKTNATDDLKVHGGHGHSSPERPSSPVFEPGHLRTSIEFFENLKNK
ncbi:uncharacterized protein LOC131436309 isoform X3 [Malaya genurostris]|uniref:uncharacterized protein LOC131436309 isoform X3 n=1 Tax=Malaya genurostris TaxID=325434 RepID=UPI0026F37E2B|nr:uncharacterized protein LOC131436309 isoform X3 [Malaya genurostris]